MTRAALVVALALALVDTSAAQTADTPRIVNGRVEQGAAGVELTAALRAVPAGAADLAWIGYAVPAEGRANRCCWNDVSDGAGCCGGCRLERDGGTAMRLPAAGAAPAPVPLEPSADRAVVLVRVAAGAVDRIRVFSPSCTLDAGGRTVRWLPDVAPAASIAWLNAQALSASRRLSDDALMALAAHAAPAALDRLIAFARTGATTRPAEPGALLAGAARRRPRRRHHHRGHRARSRHRRETPRGVRAQPVAGRRRRAAAHRRGARALESGGAEAGVLLARPVERPARAGVLLGCPEALAPARRAAAILPGR